AVIGGAVVLAPALALLFGVTLAGRFRLPEPPAEPTELTTRAAPTRRRELTRPAISCLIAGLGLLNVADAGWAHALGVVCLLGFVALGFAAIVPPGLDDPGQR